MQLSNLRCEYFVNPLGIASPRPRLSWELLSDRRGVRQTAYRIRVGRDQYALAADGADLLWDSGRVESGQSIQVEYGGAPLRSRERAWWNVQVWTDDECATSKSPAFWEAGLLEPADWDARWIGSSLVGGPHTSVPCPYLRREWESHPGKAIRAARLYVTALGIYEFSVNGQRVGDVFRPGWTDYRKRVLYDTYDVTPLVRPGGNALGAILADGWYCGHLAHMDRQQYGDRPRLLAQVVVDYEDGTSETIPTDATWKTATGPILEADLLMGETYDARLESPGWDLAGFDDSGWNPVETFPAPEARVVARRGPAVRATQELQPAPPIAREQLPDGHRGYLFDLGENMVGTVRLRLRGPRGLTVRLRYGERLDADGSLYTANLRKARATDYYTLKGEGEEVYQPRFTFHGFQYVEVGAVAERWETPPDLTGVVLHSDTPPTGEFECSEPLVNQLQRNIQRSQRGNFLEVPTDCPQRDERLGWTGDAQAFVGTAAFNMDVAAFFTKWQDDLADAQQADGSVPPMVPYCCLGPDGGPAWADALLICPWTMYEVYGDTRLLREHYAEFVRFIEYLTETSPGRLRCVEDSPALPCFGDWLALDGSPNSFGGTAKGLIGTAFFAHSAWLLARVAEVLGEKQDMEKYDRLAGEVRTAFNERYVGADGTILPETKTQTACVLALHFDLLLATARPAVAADLVADIEKRGDHLSTGFVGSPYLPRVLTREGRADVAFRLLHQKSWPSWLYAVTQGATSIWERWDGWTEEKGFQSVGMNSFNHYAYGAVGEWLYAAVAGIRAGSPGYKHIVIRPHPGDLASARGRFHSMHGPVASEWRREGGRFDLRVEIPPNTTATVHVPASDGEAVLEGDKPAAETSDVKFVRADADYAIFEVGSGVYYFSALSGH